jgi:hypothetical protein
MSVLLLRIVCVTGGPVFHDAGQQVDSPGSAPQGRTPPCSLHPRDWQPLPAFEGRNTLKGRSGSIRYRHTHSIGIQFCPAPRIVPVLIINLLSFGPVYFAGTGSDSFPASAVMASYGPDYGLLVVWGLPAS